MWKKMKDPLDRTKVVVRQLPPAISQSAVMEQIDGRFTGRYDWARFRPGKCSNRNQIHSRVYLNFKTPEDVVEFAEFFDGHIFVNEKGAQFKAQVEYAPSQIIPKTWLKKDGREGSITKDPEYTNFLESISKPAEHLPSAEIQLERKEAERAAVGVTKENIIVTPLMDFIRQKRAAKSGAQRSSGSRLSRKAMGASACTPTSSKRGLKHKISSSVYILKDGNGGSSKDKSTYILVPRREDQQALEDKSGLASLTGKETPENEVASGVGAVGRSRIVLLKGKDKEVSDTSGGVTQQHILTSSVRNSPTSSSKHNPRLDANDKIIRTILSKEGRMGQFNKFEQKAQTVNVDRDKRPPRPPNSRSSSKDHISSNLLLASADVEDKRYADDKITTSHAHGSGPNADKHDKRPRNKDRPDRGVWAPRRAERCQYNNGTLSSTSESTHLSTSSLDHVSTPHHVAAKHGEDDVVSYNTRFSRNTGSESSYEMVSGHGEGKQDVPLTSKSDDLKFQGAGRVSLNVVENGSRRHVGRRAPPRVLKETDGSITTSEGKGSKRGSGTYGYHERQVWVQKSGSPS